MNSAPSVFRMLGVVTILLAVGVLGVAPATLAQIAAPAASAAQNSFCGSQPLCYEANDFAATITDFRTSTSGYYKVIDVGVHFQNKANQPLILAYVAGSGTALDDRGNRYAVGGGNALRGIGQAYGGNNFDPKFNLRAGGFGDAQFELIWAPGQTPYGLTFELNLTVDEINTIEANQHILGGEFPLHYRGLANGVTGAAPGQASVASSVPGLPPCSPTATSLSGAANSAGAQVPATANTAVSNATTAFSNLGSLFGKKKAAPAPAAPNTTSAAPCAPVAPSAGTSAATSMSPVNGSVQQSTGATSTASTAPASGTPAASIKTASMKTTVTPAAKPVANTAKAPVPPANATVEKAATTTTQKPNQ